MARATVTAMAMADGNATERLAAMVDSNRNGNGRRQGQWATATAMVMESATTTEMASAIAMATATARVTMMKAGSCAGNVQCYDRGDTLPPPPWTQRKVHSLALRHGGDTAKSVCSPSRGRVPDSSPWIIFGLFFTTTVQFTEQPSVCPPTIFRRSRTLSAH